MYYFFSCVGRLAGRQVPDADGGAAAAGSAGPGATGDRRCGEDGRCTGYGKCRERYNEELGRRFIARDREREREREDSGSEI